MTRRKPTPPPKIEQPSQGGSYVRQADGTLAPAGRPGAADTTPSTETPSEE